MSDYDLALPGDLPGLLRRGSPIVVADRDSANIPHHLRGRRGTVHTVAQSSLGVPLASMAPDNIEHVIVAGLDVLALDLTDPTGRVHAAWWASEHWANVRISGAEEFSVGDAWRGRDMSARQIVILRDLCLRLAGRLP